MGELGRICIVFGVVLVVIGVILPLVGKVPGLGRLPGDITIKRESFTFYFPLATCLVLSAVLTLVLWLLTRLRS